MRIQVDADAARLSKKIEEVAGNLKLNFVCGESAPSIESRHGSIVLVMGAAKRWNWLMPTWRVQETFFCDRIMAGQMI
jgi:hypothetical protein